MAKSEIIPFGKYKGQPVEVLQQDREYCEWLMEQDWFRVKFQPIYTLVVNHFGEPAETPEHNQLQARFTDGEFARRFIWHVHRERIEEQFHEARERHLSVIRAELRQAKDNALYGYGPEEAKKERRKRVDELAEELKQLEATTAPDLQIQAEFESEGIDVTLGYTLFHTKRGVDRVIHVECKPALGDDYPAILRQIAASYEFGSWRVTSVLLVGDGGYTGTGATLEQVQKIFDSRKVRIVFLKELENL